MRNRLQDGNSGENPTQSATADDEIRALLMELKRRFTVAGKGSIQRVEASLAVGRGYFKDQRRPNRKRYDLGVLLRTLDELDLDPGHFFTSALGPSNPIEEFKVRAREIRKTTGVTDTVPDRERSCRADSQLSESEMRRLDRARYSEPRLALKRIERHFADINKRQLPALLGIHASTCRVAGELNQAQVTLARAIAIAEENADRRSLANLTLRAAYVSGDRGNFSEAYALSSRATLEFFTIHDADGMGKSVLDQGIWLGCLGRNTQALEAFQAALEFFGEDERPNRFSCLLNIALLHFSENNIRLAEGYAFRASAVGECGGVPSGLFGKLLCLQAEIAQFYGDYFGAEEFFQQALETYRPISPLDTALTIVGLSRLYLLNNRPRDAYVTARSMLPLVESLEGNPLAASYLTELLRCAVAGEGLDEEIIQRVLDGCKRARANARADRMQLHSDVGLGL